MPATAIDPAIIAPQRARRGTAVLLLLAATIATVFFVAVALPYFVSASYHAAIYADRRGWLLAHIAAGAVALFSGPVQLWLGLSDRGMAVHRRLGVVYMAAIAAGAAAGYYLAFHPSLGFVFGSGLAGLATAWVVTTALAYSAIRRQLVEQHKEWMIRSYVVTLGFVTFRIIFPLVMIAGVSDMREAGGVAAWGCWAVPLLVTEAILQGRKIAQVAS